MEQMLVTKGLNELKLLENRITRKIRDGQFVGVAKHSEPYIMTKVTKEAFKAAAKADLQSIEALIARRNAIKAAIIKSNAVTIVDVAGEQMTVAEAIDKKSAIDYEKKLLTMLTTQYGIAVNRVVEENERVDESIEQLLNTAYGKEGKEKITKSSYDAIALPYRDANEYGLVDGIDIEKHIKEMRDTIENFEAEVDTVLQISNSVTMIGI